MRNATLAIAAAGPALLTALCHAVFCSAALPFRFFQKIFQGAGFSPLFKEVQASFLQARTLKPTSTRFESVETFIIAQRKKFPDKMGKNSAAAPGQPAASGATPTGAAR